MAVSPPPVSDAFGTQRWTDWFIKVNNQINLVAEDHNNLGSIQGGSASQRYHLTAAQHTTVTASAFVLNSYTVVGVPAAGSFEGGLIYVSDETGGKTIAFSDGTDWRRVQDRAIIS